MFTLPLELRLEATPGDDKTIAVLRRPMELAARSVDVMHLGEMQPERDHELTSDISYPVVYRGRQGRDARTGGFFAFRMKVRPGPLILQATYWADERARKFHILVESQRIATQALRPDKPVFFDVDYEIPEALTKGKDSVVLPLRFTRCAQA